MEINKCKICEVELYEGEEAKGVCFTCQLDLLQFGEEMSELDSEDKYALEVCQELHL